MTGPLKKVTVILLVLALVTMFGFGCAEKEEGVVTITIGEMTDLTGPASPWVVSGHLALMDAVQYYNDEGLIPGVKLKVVSWDTGLNPARTIPGYDWLRERGADLIESVIGSDGVILKPFADKDRFPVFSLTAEREMTEPPGWVFCLSQQSDMVMVTLLQWVSENHWDYSQGIPKIGFQGWSEAHTVSVERATEEYCQAHPDKFEYVGGFLPPQGTMIWTGEVEALKDCDYIGVFGSPAPAFIRDYRAKGYSATMLDPSTLPTAQRFCVAMAGWEGLNGTLSASSSPVWGPLPIIDLARDLLSKYRPGEANDIIDEGGMYGSGVLYSVVIFEILHNAIEEVGAKNLSSQAIYDAAANYKVGGPLWEGIPEWSLSETKRYLTDHILLYEWSAEEEDMVMIEDWIPMVTEWVTE